VVVLAVVVAVVHKGVAAEKVVVPLEQVPAEVEVQAMAVAGRALVAIHQGEAAVMLHPAVAARNSDLLANTAVERTAGGVRSPLR
jgi:hypothetical protein